MISLVFLPPCYLSSSRGTLLTPTKHITHVTFFSSDFLPVDVCVLSAVAACTSISISLTLTCTRNALIDPSLSTSLSLSLSLSLSHSSVRQGIRKRDIRCISQRGSPVCTKTSVLIAIFCASFPESIIHTTHISHRGLPARQMVRTGKTIPTFYLFFGAAG